MKVKCIAMIAIFSIGCVSPDTSLNQAQLDASRLEQGMTREQVSNILKLQPSQTAIKSYGKNTTSGSWTGMEWEFRWSSSYWARRLVVVFYQKNDGSWQLNHYRWFEF